MSAELDINLSEVGKLGDRIIAKINAVRAASPIYFNGVTQSWIISGHAEVVKAFSGELPLSAGRHRMLDYVFPDPDERQRTIPNMLRYFPHFLINLDPPAHTRVRSLLTRAFTKKVVEDYRPRARQVIQQVLDGVQGRSEVEFVHEIARQITARNLMRLTGFEDEEFYLPKLAEWAYLANAAGSGRPSIDIFRRNDAAFAEMAEVFLKEIESRRRNPRGDFLTTLVLAGSEQGQALSNDELIGEMILVLLAGHDTTLNTMALSVRALSRDRAACDFMRGNPDATLNSVMELMRYIAMSTSQDRIVAQDFEWQGHQFRQGQIVTIMTAGANRDPKAFDDPEKLVLTRNQDNNVTFGPGTHHCIGHLIAKMQLTEFFPEFLRRYESFEILDDPLKFGDGLTFRGPQEMRVRLHPFRAAAG